MPKDYMSHAISMGVLFFVISVVSNRVEGIIIRSGYCEVYWAAVISDAAMLAVGACVGLAMTWYRRQ
jgi:hypothetical protein